LSRLKQQIEITDNRDFFMTPPQAFEGFLVIRCYLLMRESTPKSIMFASVQLLLWRLGEEAQRACLARRFSLNRALVNRTISELRLNS